MLEGVNLLNWSSAGVMKDCLHHMGAFCDFLTPISELIFQKVATEIDVFVNFS